MGSLADEYPKEQARCRELQSQYRELGPVGSFGYVMIEQTLREADAAAASGDVVAMLQCYQAMKDCR